MDPVLERRQNISREMRENELMNEDMGKISVEKAIEEVVR